MYEWRRRQQVREEGPSNGINLLLVPGRSLNGHRALGRGCDPARQLCCGGALRLVVLEKFLHVTLAVQTLPRVPVFSRVTHRPALLT